MKENHDQFEKWRTRLAYLQQQHAENPQDLNLASAVWDALDGGIGNNLKGVSRAISIFRGTALVSELGVEKLAAALNEVHELTGVVPRRTDFDDALYQAVTRTPDDKREVVRWLVRTLNFG